MKKQVIVMGIGNYILSDEGIGVHAVKELDTMPWPDNVEIYDCGTLGILATHKIADADILIAIDAIASKEEPGTVIVYDKEDIMLSKIPLKISPHQIGFQETLLHAQLRGDCPEVVKLIGIVPESYETSIELSESCKAALPKVIDEVKKLVAMYA